MFITTERCDRDFGVSIVMGANDDTLQIITLNECVPIGNKLGIMFFQRVLPLFQRFLDAIATTSTVSISENLSAWRVPVPPDPIIPILIFGHVFDLIYCVICGRCILSHLYPFMPLKIRKPKQDSMKNLIRGRYGARTQSFLSSLQHCVFNNPENPDSDSELLSLLWCHLQ